MAWRFKASKYKNAAPIVPKFEAQIRDLSLGSYRSHGNFIAASAAFMAFNWDQQGSNLAVLPLTSKGRQNKAAMPLIHAHTDMVTDFQFAPFDDGLLATGSQDMMVKLWRIPPGGIGADGLSKPELTLPQQPRRVETVNFNPAVDSVLATSSYDAVNVWDLIKGEEVFCFPEHDDEVQSVSWQTSGKLLATQCKDKTLRILDPRAANPLVAMCDSHQGIKDSKVVFIGDANRVLTTGFSGDRLREINIRDLRNLAVPEKNLTLDMSSGILVPLFDPDTNMCFLCGKGDRNIQFIEITDKEPYIVEGLKYSGDQTKGACLVPKRAMDVMTGEVNRVLQLTDNAIVPVTWQVPRKTYRDYHADIFPETFGLESAMGPGNWLEEEGGDMTVPKINLDPKKRPKETLIVFQEKPLCEQERNKERRPQEENKESQNGHMNGSNNRHSNNGNGNGSSSSSNGNGNGDHQFAKPAPKPRAVSRSNSEVEQPKPVPSVKPRTPVKTEPSPRPRPRTAGAGGGEEAAPSTEIGGDLDDGLSFLRRQPSIKDRKRMFEANMKKSTETANGGTNNKTEPNPLRIRTPSDEENKENKVTMEPICETSTSSSVPKPSPSVELRKTNPFLANDGKPQEEAKPVAKRPASKMFGRISKFKHLKGDVILKGRFENLKNLSKTVPAECDYVHANAMRVALPLTGPGGKIAVFEAKKAGRIPDGVTPVLINGTAVMDFGFDPFDTARLAAACDDGYVRMWRIPEGGLVQQMNEPEMTFAAHGDKVQIVKFHPLAKDVVLTAAFDRSVKIWDLSDCQDGPKLELEGHGDQLYSLAWSQCGRFLASVCRDGRLRIFDPRRSSEPLIEGGEIVAKKGARVVWAMEGQYLIVTGFSRQSERQVMVYRTEDLELLNTVVLDVSPAVMIPHYDADSNTIFLVGKGESTVTTMELSTDAPHLFPLSPYRPRGLHQGYAFLMKNVCDVRTVEFARAFRLTNSTIEPIAFTVPRVKTAFFQDDLFPETRVLWEPTVDAKEWFGGSEKPAARLDLQPEDMRSLSSTTSRPSSSTARQSANAVPASMAVQLGGNSLMREEAKKVEQDIESSMMKLMPKSDKLEQDDVEGVDEKDWDEDDDESN